MAAETKVDEAVHASTHVPVLEAQKNGRGELPDDPGGAMEGGIIDLATEVRYMARAMHVALVGKGGLLGESLDIRTQNETHVLQLPEELGK